MFIRLLGPVGAGPDEAHVVTAPGQVAAGVLAHLALAGGRSLTVDALTHAVWDDPPPSARNAVQVAVSKLRRQWGSDVIESGAGGYRLRSAVVRIDGDEVKRRLSDARSALAAGRPADALRAAEAVERAFAGEPLAALASTAAEAARRQMLEWRTGGRLIGARARVALGRAAEAVDILRDQVRTDPWDEPAHGALMEALAAAGRPGEALAVYDGLRRRLADELGTDPSPGVRAVFTRLLDGDEPDEVPSAAVSRAVEIRLPAVGGPVLGRERDVAAVTALIVSGHRLVTLLGPGGIGKTRLAVEVARRHGHGENRPVVFVDLTTARNSRDVTAVAASAVDADGTTPAEALRGTGTLVVLDNAEHVLDASVDLVSALLDMPDIGVLVTSRTPLRLRDERPFWVDSLRSDEAGDAAVVLLADRAALTPEDVLAQAAHLHALARRADGVPLVLELLAAALRWRTPAQLLARLEAAVLESTDVSRDRPERHVSVSAATDWSLREASEPARAGLGALVVARGSFAIEAAEDILREAVPAVGPAEILGELVDLSLVQRLPDPGRIRFRVLEPIRIHAIASTSVPGPTDVARRAHARHYLVAARRADDEYATAEDAAGGLLRDDDANITGALEWSWSHEPALAMAHLGPLLELWRHRQRHAEVLEWSGRALAARIGTVEDRARVALSRLNVLFYNEDVGEEEFAQLTGLIAPHVDGFDPEWFRRWGYCQTQWARLHGDEATALSWLERNVDRTSRDRVRTALERVHVLTHFGRLDEAGLQIQRMLCGPDLEDERVLEMVALNAQGYLAVLTGDFERATEALDRALAICDDEGLIPEAAQIMGNKAWVALETEAYEDALRLVATHIGDASVRADRCLSLEAAVISGLALHGMGRPEEARALARSASALAASGKPTSDPFTARKLAQLRAVIGVEAGSEDGLSAPPDLAGLVTRAARTSGRSGHRAGPFT